MSYIYIYVIYIYMYVIYIYIWYSPLKEFLEVYKVGLSGI